MAKAYWVSCYRSVSDPEALAAYAKLAGPAIAAGGGRFIARGMPAGLFEQGLDQRTVLIEFDSVAQAVAAYESPAYRSARGARQCGRARHPHHRRSVTKSDHRAGGIGRGRPSSPMATKVKVP